MEDKDKIIEEEDILIDDDVIIYDTIAVDENGDNVSDDNTLGAKVATNRNNVVSAETLRKVQSKTLNETKVKKQKNHTIIY